MQQHDHDAWWETAGEPEQAKQERWEEETISAYFGCPCFPNTRRDVLFWLATPLTVNHRLITTVWLKHAAPAPDLGISGSSPPQAVTNVFPLVSLSCPRCGTTIHCGEREWSDTTIRKTVNPARVRMGENMEFVMGSDLIAPTIFRHVYDPTRITEGGLAEAHAYIVESIRANLIPAFDALPNLEDYYT